MQKLILTPIELGTSFGGPNDVQFKSLVIKMLESSLQSLWNKY
jgi:hypothetical protein